MQTHDATHKNFPQQSPKRRLQPAPVERLVPKNSVLWSQVLAHTMKKPKENLWKNY